ncbi:MAG: proteasome subunit beta [Candidatus Pacearchaeota archaeon]
MESVKWGFKKLTATFINLAYIFNYIDSKRALKMDNEIKDSMLKTGTSIVGIVCSDGVVLAADRQVSAGNIVVSKTFDKIIPINDRLLAAITGGVSDAQILMRIIAAELKLKELKARRKATVKESANLLGFLTFRNIRNPSMIPAIVGSLVAGIDDDGTAKLYSVEPAGSISEIKDYDANFGSGMPYILGVLERAMSGAFQSKME